MKEKGKEKTDAGIECSEMGRGWETLFPLFEALDELDSVIEIEGFEGLV